MSQDFDFVLGNPKAQHKNKGYGVVIEKYPEHPVLTVHAVDPTKERQMMRMSLNTKAQNMLGLVGKQYEPSDSFPFEKVFYGTMRNNDQPVGLAIVNYTQVEDDRGMKFNKNGAFASKELHEKLQELFGFDEQTEVEFLLTEDERIKTPLPTLAVGRILEQDVVEGDAHWDNVPQDAPIPPVAEPTDV